MTATAGPTRTRNRTGTTIPTRIGERLNLDPLQRAIMGSGGVRPAQPTTESVVIIKTEKL